MKRKRFSVEQIVAVLKQAELGMAVADIIRQVAISEQTFYRSASEPVDTRIPITAYYSRSSRHSTTRKSLMLPYLASCSCIRKSSVVMSINERATNVSDVAGEPDRLIPPSAGHETTSA